MPWQDRCLRGETLEAALNSSGTALTLTRRAGNICRIWGRKEGSNAFIVAHLTCRRAADSCGCAIAVARSERCFGRPVKSWAQSTLTGRSFRSLKSFKVPRPSSQLRDRCRHRLRQILVWAAFPLTSTSSGAPAAAAAATSTSGAIAPPSGTALWAPWSDMPECMAAWDNRTHITKSRWKEICKRSLADLDL